MAEKNKDKDCIFCKIIRGEIPSEKILESENFIVIKDINPKVSGHSLVISKKHFKTFLDMPNLLFGEFLETAKKAVLKLIDGEKAQGFNLVMNNYEVAGQLVPHIHLHILPRKKDDNFNAGV
jgi:histidine triad (HIT) family protein